MLLLGDSKISAVSIGGTAAKAVYLGAEKIWPTTTIIVPPQTFFADALGISRSIHSATIDSIIEIPVEEFANADAVSYSTTASTVDSTTITPVIINYPVQGVVAAVRSTATAWISAYAGITARADGNSSPQGISTGNVAGSTTVNMASVTVEDWVEAIDLAFLGGGAPGVNGGGVGAPGGGGGAGQWGYGKIVLRTLFAEKGLDRKNYNVFLKNLTIGATAASPVGTAINNGNPSSVDLVAVLKGGGPDIKLIDTVVGSGGIAAWGGVGTDISIGQGVDPLDLNTGYAPYTGGGTALGQTIAGQPAVRAGQAPGGGGGGGPAQGIPVPVSQIGGPGAAGIGHWRFYNEATSSLHSFLQPTITGTQPLTAAQLNAQPWSQMVIPVDAGEIDFAIIGGGGGGDQGGTLGLNGAGGKGGQWRGASVNAGINVASLYAAPQDGLGAITNLSTVTSLRFEYRVGRGGAGGTPSGRAGEPTTVRIRATVNGVERTLLNEISAAGGAPGNSAGTTAGSMVGGDATGGDRDASGAAAIATGINRSLRVGGREFICKGGKGGINTGVGFNGNPGRAPGGGGGGGIGNALFGAGTLGAKGGDGAVFLAYSSYASVRKVQIFECLGTTDDSNTSFLSRSADKSIFDHTIVKDYPNSMIPYAGPILGPILGALGLAAKPTDVSLSNSVASGVTQVMKLVNGTVDPFVLVGTSQGAQIMGTVWNNHIKNNPALRARCQNVYLMGNPIREQGKTFPNAKPVGGHGIATPDLRLVGTLAEPKIWELANAGDPVATNTTSATGGNAIGDSIQNSYGVLWTIGVTPIIDILNLVANALGVIQMGLGMNEFHNLYGYNPALAPVDMTNPFRPSATEPTKPGWKIIVDHLNTTVGPSALYRGAFREDGTLDETPREFTQATYRGTVSMSATAEVVYA